LPASRPLKPRNLSGILTEADTEGLVGAGEGVGSTGGEVWEGKKLNFSLFEVACFGELQAIFFENLGDNLH